MCPWIYKLSQMKITKNNLRLNLECSSSLLLVTNVTLKGTSRGILKDTKVHLTCYPNYSYFGMVELTKILSEMFTAKVKFTYSLIPNSNSKSQSLIQIPNPQSQSFLTPNIYSKSRILILILNPNPRFHSQSHSPILMPNA